GPRVGSLVRWPLGLERAGEREHSDRGSDAHAVRDEVVHAHSRERVVRNEPVRWIGEQRETREGHRGFATVVRLQGARRHHEPEQALGADHELPARTEALARLLRYRDARNAERTESEHPRTSLGLQHVYPPGKKNGNQGHRTIAERRIAPKGNGSAAPLPHAQERPTPEDTAHPRRERRNGSLPPACRFIRHRRPFTSLVRRPSRPRGASCSRAP